MNATEEQRELYLDAICWLTPPRSEMSDLEKQGFGKAYMVAPVWVWNRERLQRFDNAALRRLYLGLKNNPTSEEA